MTKAGTVDMRELAKRLESEAESLGADHAASFFRDSVEHLVAASARIAAEPVGRTDRQSPFIYTMS